MIKKIARKDRIAFKKHSAIRMREREIYVDEVKKVLMCGEIIEEYLEDRPFPSCWSLDLLKSKNPSILLSRLILTIR
ncbi:MAG: DUF4258 domain-containing protein [Desulfosarcina sp.]|nr:DUF4258 domain-containing protein [Desulfobacterales bacterium]